ncbi:hypothetical protein MUDAN_DOGOELCO_02893 [Lactiplantibacillus mudanjiangensis]|uniref:hypothetical protein n=1 Tax=Lactiplantibacillus mudanjiangensis TaxID=1296538 RepID=UPI001014F3D1|nr:hypothetical protein [Lactiplantibacillus mudanjiangensis]VDG33758.1 hypothetical protein MUDAN_DOGOELCO_02893 [Lactiplantibacillus mudanjiangensis]
MIFLGLAILILMVLSWGLFTLVWRCRSNWGWLILWGTLAIGLTLISAAWLYVIIGIALTAD